MQTTRITDIVSLAAQLCGVPKAEILGDRRLPHIVRVRQACYVVARESGKSYICIGQHMGRDHSSVISGEQRALERAANDPKYAKMLDNLRAKSKLVKPFVEERLNSRDRFVSLGFGFAKVSPRHNLPTQNAAKPAAKMPRNDFSAKVDRDDSHEFHDNIAAGSKAFLKALLAAQSNITERAA